MGFLFPTRVWVAADGQRALCLFFIIYLDTYRQRKRARLHSGDEILRGRAGGRDVKWKHADGGIFPRAYDWKTKDYSNYV